MTLSEPMTCATVEKRNSLSSSGVVGIGCKAGTLGIHLATGRGMPA